RDAGRGARHLGGDGARLHARLRSRIRHGHGLARFRAGRDTSVIYRNPEDQVVAEGAIKVLIDAYGERVTSLPPVAIVIAAYNEAGAIGPVVQELPAQGRGLATAALVAG